VVDKPEEKYENCNYVWVGVGSRVYNALASLWDGLMADEFNPGLYPKPTSKVDVSIENKALTNLNRRGES
jgi:hypothetical protein